MRAEKVPARGATRSRAVGAFRGPREHVGPASSRFPLNSRCGVAQASFDLSMAEDDSMILLPLPPPLLPLAKISPPFFFLSFLSKRSLLALIKRLRQENVKFLDRLG